MTDDVTGALEDLSKELDKIQEGLFTHSFWYTVIMAVVVGIVTYILIKVLDRVFKKRTQGNLRFFYKLINVIVIAIAVLMVLMTIKPLQDFSRTLLAGSGLLAVVIGIAAQAALGNVFSGISIGISRPFVIGETIEVVGENITGTVTEIGLRQTVIRDLTNKYVVVPNSVIDKAIVRTIQASQQAIINYLQVNVSYDTDLPLAISTIKQAVLAHKDYYDVRSVEDQKKGTPRDVTVAVMDLGASAIVLRATVWAKDGGTGFMMLSDLRQTVLSEFKRLGIEIPYDYKNVIIRREEDMQQKS